MNTTDATSLMPTVPESLPNSLFEANSLVSRLAQISGRTPQDVALCLHREYCSAGSNVREAAAEAGLPPYIWTEGLGEFYDTTDAFLFETTIWNRSATKGAMRRWIAGFLANQVDKPLRILTFGDGLGFDSLFLAQAGHQVDYFEVSRRGIEFAERIFCDYDARVTILTAAEQLEPERYDAAVCLDVLEHVPTPTETVEFLVRVLRPGGMLFCHAPFWFLNPEVVTHLRSNRTYSGDLRRLYKPYGLRAIDAALFWNPIALQKLVPGQTPRSASFSAACRICLGGAILGVGRICSIPHELFWRWLSSRDRKGWPELAALAQAAGMDPERTVPQAMSGARHEEASN